MKQNEPYAQITDMMCYTSSPPSCLEEGDTFVWSDDKGQKVQERYSSIHS